MDTIDYTNEVWKTIPYATFYEASSFGRLRRVAPCKGYSVDFLKLNCVDKDGYLKIGFSQNGIKISSKVHIAVCAAFYGPRPTPKHQVAHADGDIRNNRPCNLRWATSMENGADKRLHGTLKGERNPSAKLSKAEVSAMRTLYAKGSSRKQLMEQYKISPSHIGRILRGENWA